MVGTLLQRVRPIYCLFFIDRLISLLSLKENLQHSDNDKHRESYIDKTEVSVTQLFTPD